MNKIQTILQPDRFQGKGKTKCYFEGWYFKIINAEESKAFAIIPGVAMDVSGKRHAFIQILDGKNETSAYYKFEFEQFSYNKDRFEISIGANNFSNSEIKLDLENIKGTLRFSSLIPWPSSWYSPGIMGPYSFVPFMECYHGILSMNHQLEGSLTIKDETINFTAGKGYMEKDWGRSFPSAYFWMQTNHFSHENISFKASVAKIPWLGFTFTGFIAGIWINNQLIQFTTYNGSKLMKSYADKEKVELIFENRNYKLEVMAHRHKATQLASPISGFMEGRIEESLTSTINLTLYDKKNKTILLKDLGRNAGLEVAGEIKKIFV